MDLLKVGKILGTHGLKGEVKIRSNSDFDDERFVKDATLYIDGKPYVVNSVRFHKNNYLVQFKGYEDINLVEFMLQKDVYGERDDEYLDDDEYYYEDLIGCDVYNEDIKIGKVKSIMSTTAHDILEISTNDHKKVMIPYVDAFIDDIDIDNKRIDVLLIKGMIDDED